MGLWCSGSDEAACLDEVVKAVAMAGTGVLCEFLKHMRRSLTDGHDLSTLHVLLAITNAMQSAEAPTQIKVCISVTQTTVTVTVTVMMNLKFLLMPTLKRFPPHPSLMK